MNESEIGNVHSTRPAILLAEDDPDQSDVLRERLEMHGYAVEAVFSGDVALQRLTHRNYAAAIMDVRMPGLSGNAVLKAFKASGWLDSTPVIMVSAFATPEDLSRYKADGAAASFSKPVKFAELLGCLRNVIHPTKS